MGAKMKVGLIGCGRAAFLHMIVYKNIQNLKVMAVSDIDESKARAFAQRFNIDKFSTDYSDILKIEDLDFVDICTPTSTHAKIALEVAEAGHNILLEKPMALTTKECEKIIQGTKKHGVNLCVCHSRLFDPLVKLAENMVNSEKYDVMFFKGTIKQNAELVGAPSWVLTPKEKGVLWETGCHYAYLLLHFLPNIKQVYAVGYKVKYPVYDTLAAIFRGHDKTYATMEISWLAEEPTVLYEIGSSDGRSLQMDLLSKKLSEKKKGSRPKRLWNELYSDIKNGIKKYLRYANEIFRKNELNICLPHFYLITSFLESLKKDLPAPVTGEEGKRTISLLECIEKSLTTHTPVNFGED